MLIPKLPSDFFPTRPTSAYLLNYKDFDSGKIGFTEYKGLTEAYSVLYLDEENRIYALKRDCGELYVFESSEDEPKLLADNEGWKDPCYMMPGAGDSLWFFALEDSEDCRLGYGLWQYVILETDEGALVKKKLRAKEVMDYAVTGSGIYAFINLSDEASAMRGGDFEFFDHTESKLYRAPLAEGNFECVWQDTDCFFYGYTPHTQAEPTKDSVRVQIDRCYSVIQQNMNGFVACTVKKYGKRLAHTYVLFDTSGDEISVRYIEGNNEKGIKLSGSSGTTHFNG